MPNSYMPQGFDPYAVILRQTPGTSHTYAGPGGGSVPGVPNPTQPNPGQVSPGVGPVAPPQGPQFDRAPAPFQGFTPKHAMEGFDFAREQNPERSAKDAFAWLSNQAPPPPLADKNALMIWFNTYIQPGMQKLGHNVTDVQGDKFRFNNWQGDFWVDYGRGAGAENGALAWQADYAQGGPANQAYNHTQRSIMGTPNGYSSQPITGVPRQEGSQNNQMEDYYRLLAQYMGQGQR
jgi:hypothetical protein